MIITATAAVADATTVATAIAAAGDQKEYDDEKPDHVVVIENIAKTIHNILHVKSKFRKENFIPLSVIILWEGEKIVTIFLFLYDLRNPFKISLNDKLRLDFFLFLC